MRWAVAAACLVLAACSSPAAADPEQPVPQVAQVAPEAPVRQPPPAALPTRANVIACLPEATQGGAILCQTDPGSALALDGKPIAVADRDGLAIIGLTRGQKSPAVVSFYDPPDGLVSADRRNLRTEVRVLARTDTVAKFEMECAVIAPQSPEDQRKAEIAWVKKENALKIFSDPLAPVALAKPVRGDFALSSSFGATRTYVPKSKDCEGRTSVHNGTDVAVPTGTEIRAPMAGTVILADADLFYEGGAVFLDLGRGLVSVTMHMSRIDVKAGDKLEQGQLLGLSGATGRVTGPHLHWAIKYRNVLSDDRAADIWLDPVLLLALKDVPAQPVEAVASAEPASRP